MWNDLTNSLLLQVTIALCEVWDASVKFHIESLVILEAILYIQTFELKHVNESFVYFKYCETETMLTLNRKIWQSNNLKWSSYLFDNHRHKFIFQQVDASFIFLSFNPDIVHMSLGSGKFNNLSEVLWLLSAM